MRNEYTRNLSAHINANGLQIFKRYRLLGFRVKAAIDNKPSALPKMKYYAFPNSGAKKRYFCTVVIG